MAASKRTIYYEPNDEYFRKHLSEFVKGHGGEWVVISGSQLIGFARKDNISKLVEDAKKMFPDDIPFLSPIPREEELECIF